MSAGYQGVESVKQGHKITRKDWDNGFIVAASPGYISKDETAETILNREKVMDNILFN